MIDEEEDILDKEVSKVFFEKSTLVRMIGCCPDCIYWRSIDGPCGNLDWGTCEKLTEIQCSKYNYVLSPYRDGVYIYDIERFETNEKFGCIYWHSKKRIVKKKKTGTIKRCVKKKSQSGG